MQYSMSHATHTENVLFIRNLNWTGGPIFYLATLVQELLHFIYAELPSVSVRIHSM